MNTTDPDPPQAPRILFTMVVFENVHGQPQTQLVLGDGFEQHKAAIAQFMSNWGERWRTDKP